MQIQKLLIASSLLITSLTLPNIAAAQNRGTPGKFDFYVLTLSWSPDHCARNGNRDPQQCKPGRKYGFVLHGLWPQYQKGYPANCTTEKLPPLVKQKFRGLFPNETLYNHEWEKHGTCSGKNPIEYLALSRQLKYSLVIPTDYNRPDKPFRTTVKDLKNAFVTANSKFTADSIAPYCSDSGRFLQEVFFCYSKDGKAGICSEDILKRSRKSCGQANFLVRNVR
ncbi:ribonuclease T2 family protein [Trichormus variabilis]|uniref:Ribonuclease n=1 Tax=Trichormus variabilis SAG 1403-4b TaxID=447716 RepID=A0A3S1APZ1_ANAVA|nr:ribonuclease [Trichormus variabilis]MBD2627717.1 ribonuclease [Trichormus variabilis FACHB-164]RUS97084.1 ribonuclease [Trichormus variabilis SAG 1403-4b]